MPGSGLLQVYVLQRLIAAALPAVLLALGMLGAAAPASAQSLIDSARQFYNQGKYDAAVKLAAQLRANPSTANAACLVLARAYLERFRQSEDRADLVAGREALREVKAGNLDPLEQAEYLVGLGQSLYLGESYGAAAEIFASALERSQDLGPRGFDRVFDWWATSLDRLAQSGVVENIDGIYAQILSKAQAALARSPGLTAPAYWTVVASRFLGDPQRAWDAAVAGWVRAPLAGEQGAALRADLDRLVLQAIIPERVRQMASTDRDRERAAATLRAAWEEIKKEWSER